MPRPKRKTNKGGSFSSVAKTAGKILAGLVAMALIQKTAQMAGSTFVPEETTANFIKSKFT